jgi:hypothetical protein
MPIASCPVTAETTRYPLVASMNLSTESSCSLSSTQRITFFGRMMGKNSLVQCQSCNVCFRQATLRPCPLWWLAGVMSYRIGDRGSAAQTWLIFRPNPFT